MVPSTSRVVRVKVWPASSISHGSYEEHGGRLAKLKALREELGKPVAALLDNKGPEIRLKEFKNRGRS